MNRNLISKYYPVLAVVLLLVSCKDYSGMVKGLLIICTSLF